MAKEFIQGATYKLKKKYVGEFARSPRTAEQYGIGVFKFVVASTDYMGNAWGEKGSLVALKTERNMFKRVDNK